MVLPSWKRAFLVHHIAKNNLMIHSIPFTEYLSTVLWLIVLIRQFRQKYFYYFLFLIAGGLLTVIIRTYSISNTNSIYVFAAFLRVVVIQDRNISKTTKTLLIISFLFICYLEFTGLYYKQEFLLICILHFLIFFKFIQTFILRLVKEKVISLFLLCLFFYELTLITKYFALITDLRLGQIYLNLTTSFEILFALFFCIFKQDSQKILIKLDNTLENI